MEIAGACSQAAFACQAFLTYLQREGDYPTKPAQIADPDPKSTAGMFARGVTSRIQGDPSEFAKALGVCPSNRPKRVEDLDKEINDFVEKRTGQKNAIARTHAPGGKPLPLADAPLDVIHTPLDAAERRQLATLEKTIERNAGAVFEFAAALRTIRDGRLYRATHSSFEAYCADRWQISKSDAHRQIQAATKYETAQPIAAKYGITLTNPSQMRPLFNVADDELVDVMKKARDLTPKAADGGRRVTAEVFTRAVREATMSPDDLKREEEKRRDRLREQRSEIRDQRPEIGGHSVKLLTSDVRPLTSLQEEPAKTPVGTATAILPVTAAAVPQVPIGINLQFDETLDEMRFYLKSVLNTFHGEHYRGQLSGILKYFSKEAVGVEACRVCGCSETDPCDGDEGEGCRWIAPNLCSACEGKD